jgi:transposase
VQRVDMHRLQELVRLHRMRTSSREAARLLGMSRNTARDYRQALVDAGLWDGPVDALPALDVLRAAVERAFPAKPPPPQSQSRIDSYRSLVAPLAKQGVGAQAIYDRLRQEHADFTGSLSAVKRLCRSVLREHGVRAEDVAIRLETLPGQEAQVDFGDIGRLYDPAEGRLRKAYVFVMVLSYSRHQFARICFDQKVETWLRLHIEAFESFGGVPEVVVPDNLKSAVIRAAFSPSDPTTLNRSYRELARHYSFKIAPTPPRSPEKKGKVESGVKYVKKNFFSSRPDERSIDILQRELERWTIDVAGQRIHGTTHEKPHAVFELFERVALKPLPERRPELVVWHQAKLHRDSHVVFRGAMYSAPWRLVGKKLWVRADKSTVHLFCEDVRVASHNRHKPGTRSTDEQHLPEHRGDYRHRARSYWEERADMLGVDVGAYIREVFDSDDVLDQLRTVQAIVTHLADFPPERAQAACRRASFYASFKYGTLKSILRKGLDFQPLPNVVANAASAPVASPRFARNVRELLDCTTEDCHEPH